MIADHDYDLMRGTPSGIVRRVLSGEPIERISREVGISTAELHTWVGVFVQAGARALDRHAHRAWKYTRPPRRTQPRPFVGRPDRDERLSIEEHQHQLWVTLGLADD